MGGLLAATSQSDVVSFVMHGLGELASGEVQSCGLGVVAEHRIERRRESGPLSTLSHLLSEAPLTANTVIGHAEQTVLVPPERRNAQPHASSRVAVAMVGSIDNHAALRLELKLEGVHFRGSDESEVAVWLLDRELANGALPIRSLHHSLPRLRGSFALVFICPRFRDRLYAASHGMPLFVGKSRDASFISSRARALPKDCQQWMSLSDGQLAELRPGMARVFNPALQPSAANWQAPAIRGAHQ
jgi:glucosamine--fructose-6-phosphate aminotransferase (isomerizing)